MSMMHLACQSSHWINDCSSMHVFLFKYTEEKWNATPELLPSIYKIMQTKNANKSVS